MRSLTALSILAAVVAGWLYAHEVEFRDLQAQQKAGRAHRSWAEAHCMPLRANERTIIERRGDGSTQCSRWENAGYGRAPVLVSAEVRQ